MLKLFGPDATVFYSSMKSLQSQGKPVYLCEICGFGYSDPETARSCENFCTAHNSCSFEITKKAVYKPEA